MGLHSKVEFLQPFLNGRQNLMERLDGQTHTPSHVQHETRNLWGMHNRVVHSHKFCSQCIVPCNAVCPFGSRHGRRAGSNLVEAEACISYFFHRPAHPSFGIWVRFGGIPHRCFRQRCPLPAAREPSPRTAAGQAAHAFSFVLMAFQVVLD